MKTGLLALLLSIAAMAAAQDILLQKTKGNVSIRHGVAESWSTVAPGDVLKPDDTMKTGKASSAVLVVDARKRILLPPEVMVDISDIRDLSQEELMLKLTMERVRASSYEWKENEMNIPHAAITHGYPPSPSNTLAENRDDVGAFEWNGARVLYDNGYVSTSALKAIDVIRRYPALGDKFENRLFVAEALEKAKLHGEALNEYLALSRSDRLTENQKDLLKDRITRLRALSRQ